MGHRRVELVAVETLVTESAASLKYKDKRVNIN